MQIWKIAHEDEIPETLLRLSTDKFKPAIVVTTKEGEKIPAEKYDAAASKDLKGNIHAFLRIGQLQCENDDFFYDLEHTQLYPEDIQEIAICVRWVSESDDPEEALEPGMKVKIIRSDLDEKYEGELVVVTFLDVVVRTAEKDVSVPVSKIRTIILK